MLSALERFGFEPGPLCSHFTLTVPLSTHVCNVFMSYVETIERVSKTE